MAIVVLISCSSQKQKVAMEARYIYTSSLFKKSLKYAQQLNPDNIFVLSAKYGLLELDQVVDFYDITLKKMSSQERNIWSKKVVEHLEQIVNVQNDEFIVLAGEAYTNPLRQCIPTNRLHEPLKGKRVGKRLKWLNDKTQ